MIVHCLGTTGYHPSPTRHTACYYLPEQALLLDAGTGLFRLVEHLRAKPQDRLDIFLSHAHLDHVIGLTFLIDVMAVTSLKQVRVFGIAEKLAAIRAHLFSEHLFPVMPDFTLCPLETQSGSLRLHDQSLLTWFPLKHPGGALGVRIDTEDGAMAYITDTTAELQADYVDHLHGLRLLMHECYFNDEHRALSEKTGHSWLGAVTELVRSLRPQRTALIHINPLAEILAAPLELGDEHHQLQMEVAQDGDILRL
jgi:ribonuclease Z